MTGAGVSIPWPEDGVGLLQAEWSRLGITGWIAVTPTQDGTARLGLTTESSAWMPGFDTLQLAQTLKLDVQHSDAMAVVTRDEPRLHWLGGLAHAMTRQRIKRAHLLVIASRMEGGANVIVEAIAAGVPVIASDISGNIGMLGEHYPGLFPFGDAVACAAMMWRTETDSRFYDRLQRACAQRAKYFEPGREAAGIRGAVARVMTQ